ncbi:MAG: hypothetical protein J3K34DRAFT_389420 [Monoraphidium minutum]|nr:MAG: hypothetical protein J3K34DRAFT_389420 [Monoraphidium minutum]
MATLVAEAPAGSAVAPVAVGAALAQALQAAAVEPKLAEIITCLADCVAEIGDALRSKDFEHAGSTNSFGDEQLEADLYADNIIFRRLRACGAAASASSEETTDIVPLGGSGYSVAFDPLDGSSIVDANFAVGSIFGVWPGPTPLGQTGRDQAAAMYSVYGPRTMFVVAYSDANGTRLVQQYQQQCSSSGAAGGGGKAEWTLQRTHAGLKHTKIIAPANLRAAADNEAYRRLVDAWIAGGYKLRYSGGMVPDVHHILAKGGGVFCNPASAKSPAKLRLLYECAPLAFVIEAAGGASFCGRGSVLDLVINDTGAKTTIAVGTREDVGACLEAMSASPAP